jgi:hypothetical protein
MGCGTVILVAFLVLTTGMCGLCAIGVANAPQSGETASPFVPAEPRVSGRIKITEKSSEYDYGYLKVVGTVTNTGTTTIRLNPFLGELTMKVSVTSKDGATNLAEDTIHFSQREIAPGESVAFQNSTHVPGEPSRIKYSIDVSGAERDY